MFYIANNNIFYEPKRNVLTFEMSPDFGKRQILIFIHYFSCFDNDELSNVVESVILILYGFDF